MGSDIGESAGNEGLGEEGCIVQAMLYPLSHYAALPGLEKWELLAVTLLPALPGSYGT